VPPATGPLPLWPPPVGRGGRGPFHSGIHAEVIAAAWRVVGAEAVVAIGADVVASAGEPLGASYPVAQLVWG
jgi:hypothetical protein